MMHVAHALNYLVEQLSEKNKIQIKLKSVLNMKHT